MNLRPVQYLRPRLKTSQRSQKFSPKRFGFLILNSGLSRPILGRIPLCSVPFSLANSPFNETQISHLAASSFSDALNTLIDSPGYLREHFRI